VKVDGTLTFTINLSATIPDKGVLGLTDKQAILDAAIVRLLPFMNKALSTAVMTLRMLGIQIITKEQSLQFTEEP